MRRRWRQWIEEQPLDKQRQLRLALWLLLLIPGITLLQMAPYLLKYIVAPFLLSGLVLYLPQRYARASHDPAHHGADPNHVYEHRRELGRMLSGEIQERATLGALSAVVGLSVFPLVILMSMMFNLDLTKSVEAGSMLSSVLLMMTLLWQLHPLHKHRDALRHATQQDHALLEAIRRRRSENADLIGGLALQETPSNASGALTQSQHVSGGLTVEDEVAFSFEEAQQASSVEVPRKRSS